MMPHAGLMDTDQLGPVAAPLMRARLHVRGGRRRLRQGKISAGILTLYDALLSAMEWYFASPEKKNGLLIKEGRMLVDEKVQYRILVRSGVLDGAFDFEGFDSLVTDAMERDLPVDYDYAVLLAAIEDVLTRLGVLPFDESSLPPEDPATF